MASLAILKESTDIANDASATFNPEAYAAAGGELMVLSMIISWILTYFFNYQAIESNPLKDRVGYNNLCVGWDTIPAKLVAGPIFALIVYVYSRFCLLDYWRAQLDFHMPSFGKQAVLTGITINGISWFLAIGIFSISPMESPMGHTLSFVQLVVGGYIGYLCNLLEAKKQFQRPCAVPFTIFYGIVCVAFGTCAMTQMIMYEEGPPAKRGPVPWWLMCTLDYMYFGCMGLQGFFRPRAPSLKADYTLVEDDDFSRGELVEYAASSNESESPREEEEDDQEVGKKG